MTTKKTSSTLGLILSGGGARGAYEAGVLHYIRTQISAADGGHRNFQVLSGSSIGAINTCFMAALAHDPEQQGKGLYEIWNNLQPSNIYNRNLPALVKLLKRSSVGVLKHLFSLHYLKPEWRSQSTNHFKSFLDTAPLPAFLNNRIDFGNIATNLRKGVLQAIAVTATNVVTGRMELFIQKRANVPYTGDYIHQFTGINVDHIMASAAIPIIFPPVMIRNTFYIDGGLKLNAPISPAIQLGADKILVIGLHHRYGLTEKVKYSVAPNSQPSIGQMVGQIMNALFSDRIQADMDQLVRINRLIHWSEKVYGKDYIEKINHMLHAEGIKGDIANRGLKKISALEITPSRDIAQLFAECYQSVQKDKKTFSTFEQILLRILDIDPAGGVDILSYLAFIPPYLRRLLELGFQDAHDQRDEIIGFLRD